MILIGIVQQVLDKSKSSHKKSIMILNVEYINGSLNLSENKLLSIEFRKHLSDVAKAFKEGDYLKVWCATDFKKDQYKNCYNNFVAEKSERI